MDSMASRFTYCQLSPLAELNTVCFTLSSTGYRVGSRMCIGESFVPAIIFSRLQRLKSWQNDLNNCPKTPETWMTHRKKTRKMRWWGGRKNWLTHYSYRRNSESGQPGRSHTLQLYRMRRSYTRRRARINIFGPIGTVVVAQNYTITLGASLEDEISGLTPRFSVFSSPDKQYGTSRFSNYLFSKLLVFILRIWLHSSVSSPSLTIAKTVILRLPLICWVAW
jgi:hypothetical protein